MSAALKPSTAPAAIEARNLSAGYGGAMAGARC
jgi:hypothetical protein